MKNLKKYIAPALIVVLGLLSFAAVDRGSEREVVLIQAILDAMGNAHYEKIDIDNDYSGEVYDRFLRFMDNSKRFYLKEDIEQLEKFRDKLDEMGTSGDYQFFDLAMRLYDNRKAQVEGFYESLLEEPFDYTVDEDLNLDYSELEYVNTEEELKERWRLFLKYQTVTRLADKIKMQEDAKEKKDTTVDIKPFDTLEVAARTKVLELNQDLFRRINQLNRDDRISQYVNSFTVNTDPHTGYFAPKQKENFDINMSGKLEGIGASLREENGYIKVVRIVPGSASYRQGELKEGDLILKVGQADESPVDVVDMRLDDAVKLIRGKKGTEVRLTVKKPGGETKVIPIIRDVVLLTETYAKSRVISEEGEDANIGYIKLPKFYANLNDSKDRSCFKDVAKEIKKLEEQGVDGMILDLRNNGGGSLNEVVKMAGLFLEEGPIVQIKSRGREPYVMKDNDDRVQYDGPLVVLVNASSASASEILAAAIQDYERGIIMGSRSTYGKGTVQRIYNLDNAVRNAPDTIKPLGAIKITVQKFYRVNGGATQLKGVIPDIVLPDNFNYIDYGEKELDNPMEWDEIEPAEYNKWDENDYKFDKVVKNSQERIDNSNFFDLMDENAMRLKKNREDQVVSLNLKKFMAYEKEIEEEAKKYKNLREKIDGMEVEILPQDLAEIESDTVLQKMSDDWHKRLLKDPYLYEAMQVIQDMN